MIRGSVIRNIPAKCIQRDGKWAWLATAFMLVYLSTPVQAAQVRVIQGQMVRLKLHNVLTTENVEKGDPIDFDVADDVVVATHMVVQKGAPARGKVVEVKGAGKRRAKDASVTFIFVSVRSIDNQEIPLRARPDKPKKAESKGNEIEANDPLPGYAERVIGAEKGKEYAAYVDSSATVDAPDVPVAPPPITTAPPAPQPQPNIQAPTQLAPQSGTTPPPANPLMSEEQTSVDFNSNPPGADILIDGNLAGTTPSTLHLDAGRHVIQLRIGGYRSWTRTMRVQPGSYPSIRATLEKQ